MFVLVFHSTNTASSTILIRFVFRIIKMYNSEFEMKYSDDPYDPDDPDDPDDDDSWLSLHSQECIFLVIYLLFLAATIYGLVRFMVKS